MVEVLNDPAYEPFWYVGLWLVLCSGIGCLLAELSVWLFRKWKRKRRKVE